MASDGKFVAETVETLSKRAALLCSNPDCGALTSGPTADNAGSLNIGEAAHIYGRTSASARYNADLSVAELSDITNGIWLCRNCHKLVDNDSLRFPAELLFEWRRQHELAILQRVGRPGDKLREKIQAEHLRFFEDTSHLAQQIVLDRPRFWEFKLTAELLRSELLPIYQRWQQLKQGMYVRKSMIIPADQLPPWLSAKFNDVSRIIKSALPLLEELNKAFGPPSQPGNDIDILTICRLIVAAAKNLLEWEEDVRFIHVDNKFEEDFASMQGVAGHQMDQLLRIPNELSKLLAMDDPKGCHELNLVFTVPDRFVEKFQDALQRAFNKI
jgi:hypothetical protein